MSRVVSILSGLPEGHIADVNDRVADADCFWE